MRLRGSVSIITGGAQVMGTVTACRPAGAGFAGTRARWIGSVDRLTV